MTHEQYLDTPAHRIAWDFEMASIRAEVQREQMKRKD